MWLAGDRKRAVEEVMHGDTRGRIVACVFVEVIIICALVIMIGWNKGVKEWFEQFEQPVLKEVDISGSTVRMRS